MSYKNHCLQLHMNTYPNGTNVTGLLLNKNYYSTSTPYLSPSQNNWEDDTHKQYQPQSSCILLLYTLMGQQWGCLQQ